MKYINVTTVESKESELVVINRSGKLVMVDNKGRELERYALTYGSRLLVRDGQEVDRGVELVEWDPFTSAILSEISGTVEFVDIVEGENLREETDRVTGLSQRIVVEAIQSEKRSPAIVVKGRGSVEKRYLLPTGSHLAVNQGDRVHPGGVLWSRSRVRRPRPRTSPVVCRAWSSCSRRAAPRSRRSLPRSTAR